jgi:ABC-2 type transport system ATP-binding protein
MAERDGAVIIRAEGLTRRFAAQGAQPPAIAVDHVDLEVREGEVLGLLGPNGAGKTTLVRMLSCLLCPSEGEARVVGFSIRSEAQQVRQVCGVTTETPGLYDSLSPLEYLRFFARLYNCDEKQSEVEIRQLLEMGDLWQRRHDRLGTFSKGMRQKVNIARALVHRPRVVFLDEPTSGLDVEAALAVREHVMELRDRGGVTFMICTHNLPEAERLCSRLALIARGRLAAVGTAAELRQAHGGGRGVLIRLRTPASSFVEAAAEAPGARVVSADDGELVVDMESPEEQTPELVRALVQAGAEVQEVRLRERSLEDVYLEVVRGAEAHG